MAKGPRLPALALALAALCPSDAFTEAGEAGAILFQEHFGARPFSMGQAYSAIGDDIFALSYNPASLSRLDRSHAAAQFTQGIFDTRFGYLGFGTPLNPRQSVGLSVSYLDAGKAEIFDSFGAKTNTVSAQRDFAVSLGYAQSFHVLPGRLHVGAASKLLRSVVADDMQAVAAAADAGTVYERPLGGGLLSLGAAVSNMGPGVRYRSGRSVGARADPLPLTSRASVGWGRDVFTADRFVISAQFDRVAAEEEDFAGVGFEYVYRHVGALRLGCRTGQDLGQFTMGIGAVLGAVSIDYGIALVQSLNNFHQISANYRFTIPGIRYGNRTIGPTAVESMSEGVRRLIRERKYFEAHVQTQRLKAFFPDAREVGRLNAEISSGIEELLELGPGKPGYFYARGFETYWKKDWEEARKHLESASRSAGYAQELAPYLAEARKTVGDRQERSKLELQARIATLFDLASRAFEGGDRDRAKRMIDEILRLGPYRPAERLRERIAADAARERKKKRRSKAGKPRPALAEVDVDRSEILYNEATRQYLRDELKEAQAGLIEAIRINPGNQSARNFLSSIEKELARRSGGGGP